MKTIVLFNSKLSVLFKVNWFEYIVLKRIFSKHKYELLKQTKPKGYFMDTLIVDEMESISEICNDN